MVVITRRDGPPITVPPGLRSFSAALMGFMETAQRQTELGLLDEWIIGNRHRSPRTSRTTVDQHGLRFAFYGRTSTIGHQDRTSSQGWQREVADSVVAGHGGVVVEFFDAGCSRRLPWSSRPEAAALLAELSSADRRFDAVVIGEYERAFYGEQFARVAALLDCFGVQVWLPESGGPVHLADPMHRALVTVLGAQSQREVLRSRHRVLAAMRTQAREQGRYLGGRPPYGYRLVDAGPHPNRAHAGWGRRLRRLDSDPVTAPHVQWMFQQRLAGRSVASIARELTERGVPCPSGRSRSQPAPCRRCLAVADGRGDLSQSALHRAPGMGPTVHGTRLRSSVAPIRSGGGLGHLGVGCPSRAGERGPLRCRAASARRSTHRGR